MNNNNFTGIIPAGLIQLASLRVLNLGNNSELKGDVALQAVGSSTMKLNVEGTQLILDGAL